VRAREFCITKEKVFYSFPGFVLLSRYVGEGKRDLCFDEVAFFNFARALAGCPFQNIGRRRPTIP